MKQFKVVSRRNGEFACLCPFHDDKTPSLFINLDKDKAICFAGCFAGTARGAIRKLLGYLPTNPSAAFAMASTWVAPFRGELALAKHPRGVSYLLDRGFKASTLAAWKVSYDEDKGCVAIPARRRSGATVGTIYRQTDPEALPKYIYSAGFRVSHHLFGVHMFEPLPAKSVYLTEGPLDCMWMWQCGYLNTVALLGCNAGETQLRLLRRLSSTVVLCLDSDKAGVEATRKIGPQLVRQGWSVSVVCLAKGKKDVQEHSSEELREVLAHPRPLLGWLLEH